MFIRKVLAALAVAVCLDGSAAHASAPERSLAFPRLNPLLKAYLRKTLAGENDSALEKEESTRVISAAVGISSEKTEVLVYVTGGGWCGTGGCTLFILDFDGKSFREIGHTPAVDLPIRLLKTRSHGRPDIGVWEAWGAKNCESIERFDGRRYTRDDKTCTQERRAGSLFIGEEDKGQLLFK